MSTVDSDIQDATPLSVIMHKHDTDKLYPHCYSEEYERHFGPIRRMELRILEIGIGGYSIPNAGGAGLRTWADYFPNAIVVGLDIEDKRFVMTDRIWFWIGDQSDPQTLITLNEKMGPFDIIIDDGSHVQEHIQTSFETLFPLLNPAGIYVIEDLATAYTTTVYEPAYGQRGTGGCRNPLRRRWFSDRPNSIRTICSLVDGLHHEFWRGRKPTHIQEMVRSVHVSKELAFIYKQ